MKYMFYRALQIGGLLIFVLLGGMQFLYAEMYKFTDKDGIVHYTNVRPVGQKNVKTFSFPCYASDPTCNQLDWEKIPLNRRAFDDEIRAAAQVYTVDDSLIRAIIHAESAYQPAALSPRGAQGLMQLMPATQQEMQIADVFDPLSNIEGGTLYLSRLLTLDPAESVAAVMSTDVLPIPAHTPSEQVVWEFENRDLLSAPVVDDNYRVWMKKTICSRPQSRARNAGQSGSASTWRQRFWPPRW